MTRIIITAVLPFAALFCFGQDGEKGILLTKYKFVHIYDSTKSDQPSVEIMQLLVSKNLSLFSSYEHETEYAKYKQGFYEQVGPDGTVMRGSHYPANHMKKSDRMQFNAINEGKSYSIFNLVYLMYVGYDFILPGINWTITKDTKSINDLKCQKATAFVKGRQYEAWFAPSLPFSTGPWKLHGLPGLILEAYDDKRQVQFLFQSLENINEQSRNVRLPKDMVKTTRSRFDGLMESFKQNPFIITKLRNVSDEIADRFLKDNEEIIARQRLLNAAKKQDDINNPIEL